MSMSILTYSFIGNRLNKVEVKMGTQKKQEFRVSDGSEEVLQLKWICRREIERGETSYLCPTTFCVIKEVDCSTSVVAFSTASNNLPARNPNNKRFRTSCFGKLAQPNTHAKSKNKASVCFNETPNNPSSCLRKDVLRNPKVCHSTSCHMELSKRLART